MNARRPINTPVVSATTQENALENPMPGSSCSGKDMVALMVLGDRMVGWVSGIFA